MGTGDELSRHGGVARPGGWRRGGGWREGEAGGNRSPEEVVVGLRARARVRGVFVGG